MRRVAALLLAGSVGSGLGACSGDPASPADLGFDADCDLFSGNVATGQNRDAIPALTLPFVARADDQGGVDFMRPEDRVLGVVIEGEARAYPFFILWWHEVVNDVLGDRPIAVTYCPLTGSGITFSSEVDGVIVEFGVSGLVFENNLMMFDRATESLWPQMLLQARCGPAAGTPLELIHTVETTWAEWVERHPSTTVVTPSTGFPRDYGAYPYGNYDFPSVGTLLFPSSPYSGERLPKERVLALEVAGDAVAYPYFELADEGESAVVNDVVGGEPVVVTFDSPSVTAMAFNAAVDGQVLTFTVSAQDPDLIVDDQTGSRWTLYGEATAGPLAGSALVPRADAYIVFWFAWSVFHPQTRLGI